MAGFLGGADDLAVAGFARDLVAFADGFFVVGFTVFLTVFFGCSVEAFRDTWDLAAAGFGSGAEWAGGGDAAGSSTMVTGIDF